MRVAGLIQALAEPLHEVASVPAFLRCGVEVLGEALGASKAVFSERATVHAATVPTVHFVHWPEWCAAQYQGCYWHDDPLRHWLAGAQQHRTADAVLLSDLVPQRLLVRADYYQALMVPAGARHVLSVALREGGRVTGALSLVRSAQEGAFRPRERELLATLAPLLALGYRLARERAAQVPAPEPPSGDLACWERLSPREREVAGHAMRGESNKQIARRLATSPWTVKKQLRAVFDKLQVPNRAALGARYTALELRRMAEPRASA